MAGPSGIGGNRVAGTGFNGLDQVNGDPNSLGNMSTKDLLNLLQQMMNPQQAQGGQQGGPQAAGGSKGAGASNGGQQFSLEELLKELQKRAQQNQDEMANQLRQVNNARQPSGGQNQPNGQSNNLTNNLLATAPQTFDVGNMGGLNIQSGGGFTGGGAFA